MRRMLWILAITVALASAQEKQSAEAQNVELTVYLLSGSAQGTDDVPQDLLSTLKQLHSVFAYKSYKLTESFVLRGRSDQSSPTRRRASTNGILPGSGLRYVFGYDRLWVSGDPPRTVHLDRLSLDLNGAPVTTADGKQRSENVANVESDLDIRDGQKIVVGKSSVNMGGDALILVIVPKVID
jgi:hypothetical protein